MKQTLILVITAVLLITGSIASAPLPIKLYAGAGITKPTSMSDLEDGWKDGFNVMGGIGLGIFPVVDIVGKVEYHEIDLDWDALNLPENIRNIFGNDLRLLMVGIEARYELGIPTSTLKPFIFAGVGMARMTYSSIVNPIMLVGVNELALSNQNKTYINYGAGLSFSMGPLFDIFLQIQQVKVTTENKTSTLFPITLGIKL